jgi:methylenetetrahydrofolate reductase (NADPH)
MRIDQILAAGAGPVFSFEFFPPKTSAGEHNLYAALTELRTLEPSFVSVTYGAGGSTREKTLDIVHRIRAEFGLEAMAHFTCVGATVPELRATLDQMLAAGIDNVLALRGDPPAGHDEWVRTEGGLEYSRELVALIRADYPFAIGAACFPETHIHALSPEADLAHLVEKVDAGVDFLITQLFFDNSLYFDFVSRVRAAGIEVPIIPGIMPITHAGQVERMATMCGASIPAGLREELQGRGEDAEAVLDFGVAYATLQCAELLAAGAPGIHFYTLNRSPATRAILSALKLSRPWESAPAPASSTAGPAACSPAADLGEPAGA